MPAGMLLKSHAWSSSLSDPGGKLPVERHFKDQNTDYRPEGAMTLQQFVDYGDAFKAWFAADLAEKKLVSLEAVPNGYRGVFDDGEVVEAKRFVLAVGVHPFRFVPANLACLPATALSHSSDHGALDGFDGKGVVVVGGGSSAIDLAALLHERGVSVSLVARAPRLKFQPTPAGSRDWWRELARPSSGLGVGWPLWLWANAPEVFHALPGSVRRHVVRTTLGPLGGPTMRERLEGKLPIHLGCDIERAEMAADRVQLGLRGRDGRGLTIETDHVIAATGFRIDFNRLPFLAPDLRRQILLADGAPVLSRDYETSARGLYVIGPASAPSLGPVARFVYGAYHPAQRLARRFAAAPERARPRPQAGGVPSVAGSS